MVTHGETGTPPVDSHRDTLRARLPEGVWERILEGAPLVHASAGQAVYRAGEAARPSAVLSGIVRMFIWSSDSRQTTLRYARAGDIVGLAASLAKSRVSEVEAVTDATLAMLSPDHIHALAEASPELAWLIAEAFARSSMTFASALASSQSDPAHVRVARHLLAIAMPTPDGRIAARITQQRLADAAGTAREVVSRALRDLRHQGILSAGEGRLVVLDAARLAAIAHPRTKRASHGSAA